jgi:hypothetical protein
LSEFQRKKQSGVDIDNIDCAGRRPGGRLCRIGIRVKCARTRCQASGGAGTGRLVKTCSGESKPLKCSDFQVAGLRLCTGLSPGIGGSAWGYPVHQGASAHRRHPRRIRHRRHQAVDGAPRVCHLQESMAGYEHVRYLAAIGVSRGHSPRGSCRRPGDIPCRRCADIVPREMSAGSLPLTQTGTAR